MWAALALTAVLAGAGWACVAYHGPEGASPDAVPFDGSTPDASTPEASTADAGTADAGTPDAGTPDAGLPRPRPPGPHLVFVSSATYTGKMTAGFTQGSPEATNGIAAADAHCTQLANASGIASLHDRSWVAWLSTSNSAARIRLLGQPTGSPAVLPKYVLAAEVSTEIFADNTPVGATTGGPSPNVAINVDENGSAVGNALVWTATSRNGSYAETNDPPGPSGSCNEWTSNDAGLRAIEGVTSPLQNELVLWCHINHEPCDQQRRIYCFEKP